MKIEVFSDYKSMSKQASLFVAQRIIEKPNMVLGLPTGDTPKLMYQNLVKLHEKGLIDFSGLETFNLDEYYPISQNHPKSFYRYMHDRFLENVNVPKNGTHIPDGSTENIERECQEYEKAIKKSGGIDLTVLGIGKNGHIGYNEPGSEFGSKTRLVELDESITLTNKLENTTGSINKALTMGISTIMRSKEILLLASGTKKKKAIKSTVRGEVTTNTPASVLQLHPSTTIYLDEYAAEDLGEY